MWNLKTKLNKIVDKTQPIIRKGVENIKKSIKENRDKKRVMREIEQDIENARLDTKGIKIMKVAPRFSKEQVREFVREQEKKERNFKSMNKGSGKLPEFKPYNIMGDNPFQMKKKGKKKKEEYKFDIGKSIF